MKTEVLLGLGSNQGDREERLRFGVRALSRKVELAMLSSVYESAAVIHEEQPDFLNMVVFGSTTLEPSLLLRFIHSIEAAAGRERSFRGAPRPLDIDILFFGARIIRGPELTIPHPGWRERAFVLLPLEEIVPGWVDPESGRTVEEVAESSRASRTGARRVGPPPQIEESE